MIVTRSIDGFEIADLPEKQIDLNVLNRRVCGIKGVCFISAFAAKIMSLFKGSGRSKDDGSIFKGWGLT